MFKFITDIDWLAILISIELVIFILGVIYFA